MRALNAIAAAVFLTFAAASHAAEPKLPDAAALEQMTARFAPVDIRVDLGGMPANERAALAKLVEASRIVDAIYLRQVSAQSTAWLYDLSHDRSALGQARLRYFLINKGPWSELDHDAPFVPGVGTRPEAGNFYAASTTKAEVEAWMNALPAAEKAAATGFFTTIRRGADGKLAAIPYSIEYQPELEVASRLLSEAAAATTQPTLKHYLETRAKAFLTNDYYESDVAWMELDATIEPTIGPYEVYEDEWFNFKAAFESFIAVTDAGETAKLARFGAELQELEDHLPIDPKHRRAKLGGLSPIRVVNVVYTAGDANHGVQTAAFNLPNDERVVSEKGSKRVMLRNFQQAKFDQVLVPLSKISLAAEDQDDVSFDAFFTHILMHELMHGLGPQTITIGGRETTVRQELKELNGQLEEAKADISGLWALQYLMDKGVIDKRQERAMYVTFLASAFRTLRFGINEAHAKGMALQLNSLLDHGAFVAREDGTFAVDLAKAKSGAEALTRELMTIQATGDYAAAAKLVKERVVIRPEVQRAIDRMGSVPVDIAPRFVTADELTK